MKLRVKMVRREGTDQFELAIFDAEGNRVEGVESATLDIRKRLKLTVTEVEVLQNENHD